MARCRVGLLVRGALALAACTTHAGTAGARSAPTTTTATPTTTTARSIEALQEETCTDLINAYGTDIPNRPDLASRSSELLASAAQLADETAARDPSFASWARDIHKVIASGSHLTDEFFQRFAAQCPAGVARS
jgi:hypothetical protein